MMAIDRPSPNFNARTLPVQIIVLHYTGMPSAEAAIARVTDAHAEASAQRLVTEIVNPGHEFGYRPFPDAQMESVIALAAAATTRFGVAPANVVGHSDIAPAR